MVATTEEARPERPVSMLEGFKNFLMQGDVVIVANPLVQAAGGGGSTGLGFHVNGQLVNIGAFISALIYFVIFMLVIYFVIIVPYRAIQKRRGVTVFGDPPPAQTCPACLSEGLPIAATKCRYCGTGLGAGA
jgi:large conductance mechanosensitive channel